VQVHRPVFDPPLEALDEEAADGSTGEGEESDEAEHVGQHARGDEQGAGHEDDHAIDQFVAGQAAVREALVEALPHRKALAPGQEATGQPGRYDDCDRGPKSDVLANLNEQGELNDRRDQKKQNEAAEHGASGATEGERGRARC